MKAPKIWQSEFSSITYIVCINKYRTLLMVGQWRFCDIPLGYIGSLNPAECGKPRPTRCTVPGYFPAAAPILGNLGIELVNVF